ncbi:MAG TPA: translation initiation factor IF-2 N-terminal domain-containing protein, partial [Bacteroidota bacterium]|nr:translation initiation factor IF-2 N-terminal domain-containing protein [Bacteroidota bacterium]
MAETAEKKKKVYKVATELNLSHETLIEFLRKKGHEVKGHMSTVDADMMRDILIHFKKEKDVAEKHQRKIQEIRETKKRAERKAVEEEAGLTGKTAKAGAEAGVKGAELPGVEEGIAVEEH